MSIDQYVNAIHGLLYQGENVNSYEYNKAINDYLLEMRRCESVSSLKKIVEENLFLFPVDILLETSRRFVELDRSAENLRLLSNYLYMHGPDWDEEAERLKQEADKLEGLSSTGKS